MGVSSLRANNPEGLSGLVGVPDDPRRRRTLMDWFAWMATAMAAFPRSLDDVPDDLPLSARSWNDPVNAP